MRPPIVSHVIDFVKWKHPANHKQTEWKMQHANCCKCPVEFANHVQTMYNVSSPGQLGTDFDKWKHLSNHVYTVWKTHHDNCCTVETSVETMCKSYIHYYARRKLQKLCKPYFVSAQRRVRKPCANLYDDDVVVVVGLSSYTVVLIVLLHMQTLCKQIANK
jgi:hypothetical protein